MNAIRTGLRHARTIRHCVRRWCAPSGSPSAPALTGRSCPSSRATSFGRRRAVRHPAGGHRLGAVGGAFILPRLQAAVGPDRLVALAMLGTPVTLVLLALAHGSVLAVVACLIAGASWIAVLSSLNVSAQSPCPIGSAVGASPCFVTVFNGGMALGSVIWARWRPPQVFRLRISLPAAAVVIVIPLTWRWKLQTGPHSTCLPRWTGHRRS